MRGLVRLRSWGIVALAGAGVVVASFSDVTSFAFASAPDCACHAFSYVSSVGAALAVACLAAAVIPFAGAIVRHLRRPA